MAGAGTDEDRDVALRCRVLTQLYAGGNSRVFAEKLGIGYKSWNGIENSGALSKDVARRIWRKWPQVSLDWLWRGQDQSLPQAKIDELAALYVAVVAEFGSDRKDPAA